MYGACYGCQGIYRWYPEVYDPSRPRWLRWNQAVPPVEYWIVRIQGLQRWTWHR